MRRVFSEADASSVSQCTLPERARQQRIDQLTGAFGRRRPGKKFCLLKLRRVESTLGGVNARRSEHSAAAPDGLPLSHSRNFASLSRTSSRWTITTEPSAVPWATNRPQGLNAQTQESKV